MLRVKIYLRKSYHILIFKLTYDLRNHGHPAIWLAQQASQGSLHLITSLSRHDLYMKRKYGFLRLDIYNYTKIYVMISNVNFLLFRSES